MCVTVCAIVWVQALGPFVGWSVRPSRVAPSLATPIATALGDLAHDLTRKYAPRSAATMQPHSGTPLVALCIIRVTLTVPLRQGSSSLDSTPVLPCRYQEEEMGREKESMQVQQ
jgi:hypothetical protein